MIYNHCKHVPITPQIHITELGDTEQTSISYTQVGQGRITDSSECSPPVHKNGQMARGDSSVHAFRGNHPSTEESAPGRDALTSYGIFFNSH